MKKMIYINALVITIVIALSSPTVASGFPECSDDECMSEKNYVLQRLLLPLVQLGSLSDLTAIEQIAIPKKYALTKKIINERGEHIWRWPSREFSQISLWKGKVLRIEISTEFICIRRLDVEKVFKESWLIGQTLGQWLIKDRQSHPDKQHNGVMSFREGKPFRYVFGFQPSGCSNSFDIFVE